MKQQRHGWEAACADVSDFVDAAALREYVEQGAYTAVLGVHAYRAGNLLLRSKVPYALVLGGTDVNVMAHDPLKVPLPTPPPRCLCQRRALWRKASWLKVSI